MTLDLALETGAQRFFTGERGTGLGGDMLRGGQSGFCLGDFRGQLARGLREAGTVELDRLKSDEGFDVGLHP
jgi:hypothetical protein